MKTLKFVLLLPIRIVVIAIEIVLTVISVLISIAGAYLGYAGGLVGGIFIFFSFFCLATGQIPGMMFVKMFLTGAALGSIPAVLAKIGEEGIDALKNVLRKLAFA